MYWICEWEELYHYIITPLKFIIETIDIVGIKFQTCTEILIIPKFRLKKYAQKNIREKTENVLTAKLPTVHRLSTKLPFGHYTVLKIWKFQPFMKNNVCFFQNNINISANIETPIIIICTNAHLHACGTCNNIAYYHNLTVFWNLILILAVEG